ncbi:MAG: O-antigen ligase family protein [Pirellulales bacterium]
MSLLLVLVALALVAWLPIFLFRLPLVAGELIFLLLTNCFASEFWAIECGPITMSLDRFFLVALGVAFLAQRWTGAADAKPIGISEWLLISLLALLAVSAFTHNWQDPRLAHAPVIQHLINGYLVPAAVFWIARQSRPTERQLWWTHVSLIAFGVYLAVCGLAEATGNWWLVYPKYIASSDVGIHFGRARGPMVHAVTYGATLAIAVVAGCVLWPRVGRTMQLVLLAALPLAAAGIFYSYTRSTWMGAALGLAIVLALQLPRAWKTLIVGGAVAAGSLFVVANLDQILAFNRSDNSAAETRESVDLRGTFAYVSWKMFQDRPLLGVGFGQFPLAKHPYLSDRTTALELESIRPYVHHNTVLSILTEIGLVGLALFVALLASWGRAAWRVWRTAESPVVRAHGVLMLGALGVYLCQCAFHEMSFGPRDHALLFFLAGLTCSLAPKALAAPTKAFSWPTVQRSAVQTA